MIDPRDPAPHHYEPQPAPAPRSNTGGVITAAVLILVVGLVIIAAVV